MTSGSIHVAAKGIIYPLLWPSNIPFCVCVCVCVHIYTGFLMESPQPGPPRKGPAILLSSGCISSQATEPPASRGPHVICGI